MTTGSLVGPLGLIVTRADWPRETVRVTACEDLPALTYCIPKTSECFVWTEGISTIVITTNVGFSAAKTISMDLPENGQSMPADKSSRFTHLQAS
jgi:hypothetical protein